MGWSEFIIIMLLIIALIATLLFWQMRSFGYAVIFGLLFVLAVFAVMNSPLGDQIRKEMQDQKAAASQVKEIRQEVNEREAAVSPVKRSG